MSTSKPKLAEWPLTEIAAYDGDFFAWAIEQARMLDEHSVERLDWSNLAEEIRSVGNAEKNEIESRLAVLLVHLLKWAYQPGHRKGGWEAMILEQRIRIARRIRHSPSLWAYPAEILDDEYAIARLKAADETALALDNFPDACPLRIEQILDPDFLPEGAP